MIRFLSKGALGIIMLSGTCIFSMDRQSRSHHTSPVKRTVYHARSQSSTSVGADAYANSFAQTPEHAHKLIDVLTQRCNSLSRENDHLVRQVREQEAELKKQRKELFIYAQNARELYALAAANQRLSEAVKRLRHEHSHKKHKRSHLRRTATSAAIERTDAELNELITTLDGLYLNRIAE